jgi:peptidoglycan/LPS O-acetylase OafA/YrhL
MEYKKHIDGLRGLSVLSVIGFHLFPIFFSGGFIGVDVFFVISGFLITSIILEKINNDSFSFAEFYARRVRRLFPSLLVVLLFFLAYGYFVLLPREMASVSGNIFWGTLSLANFFSYTEVGYFDVVAIKKPFLHLWSLSVEEQFYFFFPIFLIFFMKVDFLKKRLLFFIGVVVFLSFLLNILLMRRNPSFTYFFPLSRAWEIMAGALLASISEGHREKLRQTFGANILSIIGILLIVVPVFYYHEKNLYPGWRAFFPVLGAFMVLLSDYNAWINRKLFSYPLLVLVGKISYPLYLVHWPIIAFINIIQPELFVFWPKILIILASFMVSFLLYHFLEKKIQKKGGPFSTGLLVLGMLLTSVCSFFFYKIDRTSYVKTKYPEITKIEKAIGEWGYPPSGLEPFVYKNFTFYKMGSEKESILFFGDSNMEQYAPRIAEVLKTKNVSKSVIFSTGGGWLPIPYIFSDQHFGYLEFVNTVLHLTHDKNIKTVVIGAQWQGYLVGQGENGYYFKKNKTRLSLKDQGGVDMAFLELENMIKKLILDGKKVYIILNMPGGEEYDPKSFFSRNLIGKWNLNLPIGSFNKWNLKAKKVSDKLKEIARNVGAHIIDPTHYLCHENTCQNLLNGDPIYKDGGHLRPSYVKDHIKFLDFLLH